MRSMATATSRSACVSNGARSAPSRSAATGSAAERWRQPIELTGSSRMS
jgi:hypothetical protein